MGEKEPISSNNNMHAILLGIVGIILVIFGAAEFEVSGMPLRGSGIGTVSLIIGIVLLLIALWRYSSKRA